MILPRNQIDLFISFFKERYGCIFEKRTQRQYLLTREIARVFTGTRLVVIRDVSESADIASVEVFTSDPKYLAEIQEQWNFKLLSTLKSRREKPDASSSSTDKD